MLSKYYLYSSTATTLATAKELIISGLLQGLPICFGIVACRSVIPRDSQMREVFKRVGGLWGTVPLRIIISLRITVS